MELKIRRAVGYSFDLPDYATAGASGLDLRSAESERVVIPSYSVDPVNSMRSIRTGIHVAIPEGFEGQVRGRSGLAFRHRIFATHIGTIDCDYRGEIHVLIGNLGARTYAVNPGDKVAQLVIAPVARVKVVEVGELPGTERGERGFGSSGLR